MRTFKKVKRRISFCRKPKEAVKGELRYMSWYLVSRETNKLPLRRYIISEMPYVWGVLLHFACNHAERAGKCFLIRRTWSILIKLKWYLISWGAASSFRKKQGEPSSVMKAARLSPVGIFSVVLFVFFFVNMLGLGVFISSRLALA